MAIITFEEVKSLLQINNGNKDLLIQALIPIVEDDLLTYLNNDFNSNYPEGLKLYLANMINYKLQKPKDNVKSETISRYSVSYNTNPTDIIAGYPASIMKGLHKWRKVKWG